MRWLTVILLLIAPLVAQAQIVSALDQTEIEMTTTFSGAQLEVYGAVKGEESQTPLDVIVVIEGPSTPLTIRRKEHVYGIWINTQAAHINHAPSFYAIASTAPIDDIIEPIVDDHYDIGFDQIFAHGAVDGPEPDAFAEAVVRIKTIDNLYQLNETGVNLVDNTLFRAVFEMPSKVIEGPYVVQFYLLRDGQVFAHALKDIHVGKVGFERWIYDLAQENALIYAAMALVIAAAAGWGASFVFTRLFSS